MPCPRSGGGEPGPSTPPWARSAAGRRPGLSLVRGPRGPPTRCASGSTSPSGCARPERTRTRRPTARSDRPCRRDRARQRASPFFFFFFFFFFFPPPPPPSLPAVAGSSSPPGSARSATSAGGLFLDLAGRARDVQLLPDRRGRPWARPALRDLSRLDLGDVLRVGNVPRSSRVGTPSLLAGACRIDAKALRPLPLGGSPTRTRAAATAPPTSRQPRGRRSAAVALGACGSCDAPSTPAVSSRSRPPSCRRSTAARRPVRSGPAATPTASTSACGSRPSCTSSGSWWPGWNRSSSSAATSATRAPTRPTTPSSAPSRPTSRAATTRRCATSPRSSCGPRPARSAAARSCRCPGPPTDPRGSRRHRALDISGRGPSSPSSTRLRGGGTAGRPRHRPRRAAGPRAPSRRRARPGSAPEA